MEQVSATRTELLATRARTRLATQGRDLLVDKRNQLMREFHASAGAVLAGSDELERAAAEATLRLSWAEALDGPEPVSSASLAAAGEVFLDTGVVTVMGVQIPVIERKAVGRPRTGRGYALSATDPRIDAVADAYEDELDLLVDLAAGELRVRRLAREIGATTRRVNALEQVLIPRLRAVQRRISLVLEEREREDHFRLGRAKRRRAARAGASGGPR